jgi:uncharacterized protein
VNDRDLPLPLDDPLPTEPQVASFLREHPEFLSRHPALLAEMRVPHQTGGSVSLIERQVEILRAQQRVLDQGYRELIQIACDNEDLKDRLHRLTLRLLRVRDLKSFLTALQEGLADEGRAEISGLLVFARPTLKPGEAIRSFVGEEGPEHAAFVDLLRARQLVCGAPEAAQGVALFGTEAREVRSAALVPLGCRHWTGVLGAGSRDPDRYPAGLGVEFLAQLGEVTSAILDPYLPGPPVAP